MLGLGEMKKEPVDKKKRPISSLTAALLKNKVDKPKSPHHGGSRSHRSSSFDALIMQAEIAKRLPPTPSPEPRGATLEQVQSAMKRARITDDEYNNGGGSDSEGDSEVSSSSSADDEIASSAPSMLALLSQPRPIHGSRSGSLPLLLLAEEAASSPPVSAAGAAGRARSSTFSSGSGRGGKGNVTRSRRASDATFVPPAAAEFSATFSTTDPGFAALMRNMMATPAVLPALSSMVDLRLKVIKHPPPRAIYKRIIKPYPSVSLLASEADKNKGVLNQNLFVETSLVRADSLGPLRDDLLEGNTVARISDKVHAVFNKLKINSTSQMAGSSFRLRFVLKRFTGSVFETVPDVVAHSDPIEVFSHTVYLNNNGRSSHSPSFSRTSTSAGSSLSSSPVAQPNALHQPHLMAAAVMGAPETVRPVCLEILPPMASCRGGTRVVVLGYHFARSEKLAVRFGELTVAASFHEEGTVIAVTPPHAPGLVPVRVSNDGTHFSETVPPIFFTFLPGPKLLATTGNAAPNTGVSSTAAPAITK